MADTCGKGHPYTEENTYIKPNGSRNCRDCQRGYNRTANQKPERKQYNIKIQKKLQEEGYFHKRNRTSKYRKMAREWQAKYRNDPRLKPKQHARGLLNKAILAGKIFRKPCQECGETKVDGHHPDYTKPLDVIWLCRPHHAELHAKLRKERLAYV